MQKTDITATPIDQGRRWHRAGLATSVVFGVLAGVAAVIPVAVNHTAFRNVFLNHALQKHGLTAEATESTGGWFTPFEFHDVAISNSASCVNCQVDSLKSGRSLLSHLLAGSRPRIVTLIRPRIEIALDEEGRLQLEPLSESASEDIAFQIHGGEFSLRVPWRKLPIVELDHLDVEGKVVQETDGRWLIVNAVDVLHRAQLSDRHTEQNLALVAPLLSQTTLLKGTVSAQLDPIRICLDDEITANQVLLHGTVQIHSLEARLRKKWSQSIVHLVGQLNQSQIPAHLKLMSESSVDFHVTVEGIHHTGFTLLLPDVATGLQVASSGVLRLDEQIDLTLDVQVPLIRNSGSSFLNALAGIVRAPIQLRVTGTVSEPVIATPDGRTVLEEFTQRAAPALHVENPDSVAGAVGGIIQAGATRDDAERKQKLSGRIFGLIRAIDGAKKKR